MRIKRVKPLNLFNITLSINTVIRDKLDIDKQSRGGALANIIHSVNIFGIIIRQIF